MSKFKSILVTLLFLTTFACAEVTVNSLFNDHGILQHGIDIPVWGHADNGEKVSVEFCGQKVSTRAKDGKWSLKLKPLKAGGPFEMTISGSNTIKIEDILVGEVWVCSGQSNMERPLGARDGQRDILGSKEAIATANLPLLRQYKVERNIAYGPQDDANSKWVICTPQTAADFTAVGFFFGRELQEKLNVPVGIIFTAWGGTEAEAWTSAIGLKAMPEFDDIVAKVKNSGNMDQATLEKEYHQDLENWFQKDPGTNSPKPWYLPDTNISDWKTVKLPVSWEDSGLGNFDGIMWYGKVVELPADWAGKEAVINLGLIDDMDSTWINGVKVGSTWQWTTPRSYKVPAGVLKAGKNYIAVRNFDRAGGGGFRGKPEQMSLNCTSAREKTISLANEWQTKTTITNAGMPTIIANTPHMATVLYNGMLAPLQPYAIRGVVWYQGEENNNRTKQYQTLFPIMIKDWRSKWNQGNFPFLFTQIAPYRNMTPELREAQLMALTKSPNTAMAVLTDVGDANDIHPINKEPVGHRHVLAALALAYGYNIEYSGPLYKDMKVKNNKAIISFDHIGNGLLAKDGPLKGFTITGADKKFKPANAEIKDNTVIVWSDEVTEPVAVRYGWTNVPDVNLFNKEGLPASPFRTDIE